MCAPYQGSSQRRLIGVRVILWVTKADSLGGEGGGTGALSFLGVSGRGFSGEGTTLTLAVLLDEPDADKSLASLAEFHSW